ncbi:MAG TPA: DinB family protein [Pyrinomonadaceae bacterium]|nr:DinB family protein [Pyrinomonadaceae bacterium]
MADWLQDFKQTIDSASAKLMQIDEAQSERPRAEDHWSSKQIIGHLIDSAANNHARFVLGQLKDDLVFAGYDQDGWVRTNHYQERTWPELIEFWRSYNLHLHHLMSHADKAKLTTPCTLHTLQEIAFKTVPKAEPVTLEYLMRDYVDHLKHHLAQILGDAKA